MHIEKKIQGRTNRMSIVNPTLQLVVVNLYTKFEVSILNGSGDIFEENLERKKKEQIQERTNRRRPICNPKIQLVVANLYTKFEACISNSCGDIFDEKSGETEKRTNTCIWKNKKEKAHFQFHDTTYRCEPVYQI